MPITITKRSQPKRLRKPLGFYNETSSTLADIPSPPTPQDKLHHGLSDPAKKHLYVAHSTIPDAGFGLFASKELEGQTIICEYHGRKDPTDPSIAYYYDHPQMDYGIDAFDPVRRVLLCLAGYVNEPLDESRENASFQVIKGRLVLVATRPIRANEEILSRYGILYWARLSHLWPPDLLVQIAETYLTTINLTHSDWDDCPHRHALWLYLYGTEYPTNSRLQLSELPRRLRHRSLTAPLPPSTSSIIPAKRNHDSITPSPPDLPPHVPTPGESLTTDMNDYIPPLTKRRLANLSDPATGTDATSPNNELTSGAADWTDGRPASPVSPVIDLSAYDLFFSSDLPMTFEGQSSLLFDLTTATVNSAIRHELATPTRIDSQHKYDYSIKQLSNPASHNTATPTCHTPILYDATSRQSLQDHQLKTPQYSAPLQALMNPDSLHTAISCPTNQPITASHIAIDHTSRLSTERQSDSPHYTAPLQSIMTTDSPHTAISCPSIRPLSATHISTDPQATITPVTSHPFFTANIQKRKRVPVAQFIPDKRRTDIALAGDSSNSRTDGCPAPPDSHATVISVHVPLALSDISDISLTNEGQPPVIYDPLCNSSALTATRRMPAPSTKLSHDKRLDIS